MLIKKFNRPSRTPECDRQAEREQERLQRLQMTSPTIWRRRIEEGQREPIPQPIFNMPVAGPSHITTRPVDDVFQQPIVMAPPVPGPSHTDGQQVGSTLINGFNIFGQASMGANTGFWQHPSFYYQNWHLPPQSNAQPIAGPSRVHHPLPFDMYPSLPQHSVAHYVHQAAY